MTLHSAEYGAEHASDLIPTPAPIFEKSAMHISKYRKTVKEEKKKELYPAKTMGVISTTKSDSKNFLKKDQGHLAKQQLRHKFNNQKAKENLKTTNEILIGKDQMKMPEKIQNSNSPNNTKTNFNNTEKPQVPRRQDWIKTMREMSKAKEKQAQHLQARSKIKENAIRNIYSIPKLPKKIYVDSVYGNKNDLLTSGLVPRYINKENYGKTPSYINKRKEQIEETEKQYHDYVLNQQKQEALYKISESEHSEMLNSLKKQWDVLHHDYQGLSVVTDTAPKKNIKENLENAMSQIERDIEKLERHDVVYVDTNH